MRNCRNLIRRAFSIPMLNQGLSISILSFVLLIGIGVNVSIAQSLPCNGQLNVSLNSDCEYEVTPQAILSTAAGSCTSGYTIMLTDHYDQVIDGIIIDGSHLGQIITTNLIDNCTNNSCWGKILVEDKKAPTLECEEIEVICLDMESYLPIAVDNCDPSPEIFQIGQNITLEECSGDYVKTISREYIAKDHGGFESEPCIQTIHIVRLGSSDITYPIDFINDNALICNSEYAVDKDGHPNVSVTGVPCIEKSLVVNGGFETTDFTGWNIDGFSGLVRPSSVRCAEYRSFSLFDRITPCEGSCFAVTAFDGNGPGNIILSQKIIVPNAGTTLFNWSEWIAYRFTNLRRMERMYNVEIRTSDGSLTLETLYSFTAPEGVIEEGTGWVDHSIDISHFEGQNIQIVFVENIPDRRAGRAQLAIDCVKVTNKNIAYPTIIGTCKARVTYKDFVVGKDGCLVKIMREWSYVDACSSYDDINVHTQAIWIQDLEGPTINCPETLAAIGTPTNGQFNSYSYAPVCLLTVEIPPVTTSDNCSTVRGIGIEIDGIPKLNTNGGKVNVEPGIYSIKYVATDGCNISKECVTKLEVIDNSPPIAICDKHSIVGLTQEGIVEVEATVFDDGSLDICGIKEMQIARTGTSICNPEDREFGPTITFCCADVGSLIEATFRAIDFSGDYNDCSVLVEIQDKTPPNADCPPSRNVDCDSPINFNNLAELFGTATTNNQCRTSLVELDPIINLNTCNNGSITRRWRAFDSGGADVCTQIISITNPYEFDFENLDKIIIKPLNVDTTGACGLSLNPENLHPGAQRPEILDSNPCDLIGTTYKDEEYILGDSSGACMKIVRSWTILNWCAPVDKNTLQFAQIIKVSDNSGPEITLDPLNESTYCNDIQNCVNGTVTLRASALDNCSVDLNAQFFVDLNNDGILDDTIPASILIENGVTKATVENTYPLGVHRVLFAFTDACGVRTVKEHVFTLKNCKAPTCALNSLNINLRTMDEGTMECVWASDFDASSVANCSEDALSFYFDERLTQSNLCVTCTDIGTNLIDVYVVDESGNSALCQPMLTVTDHDILCSSNQVGLDETNIVSGLITCRTGDVIEEAMVGLSNTEYPEQMTNDKGLYAFESLPINNRYNLNVIKDNDHMNGVSTLDLVLIQQHILGLKSIDDPYAIIAADINKSGSISALDLVELRKLILGDQEKFTSNTSWRFLDKNYKFKNISNPFSENFPEEYEIRNLNSEMKVDFIGLKVGDISGNAITSSLVKSETRSSKVFRLLTNYNIEEESNIVMVEVTSDNFENINSFQTTLEYDNNELNYIGIEGGSLDFTQNNIGEKFKDKGYLTLSWSTANPMNVKNDKVLFKMFFKLNTNASQIAPFKSTSTITRSEVYSNGEVSNVIDFIYQSKSSLVAAQNAPNPWSSQTEITYEVSSNKNISFRIFDLFGKQIYSEEVASYEGINKISLTRNQIQNAGIYLYELSDGSKKIINKMIVLE